jgi:hypothetical protein
MRRLKAHRWGAVLVVLGVVFAVPAAGLAMSTSTTLVPAEYVGSTSQGIPVTMDTSEQGVTDFTFYWRSRCSDHKIHVNGIDAGGGSATPVSSKGKFSIHGVLNTGGFFRIKGTIKPSRAFGTLTRHGKTAFGVNCRIPTVHWRAFPIG